MTSGKFLIKGHVFELLTLYRLPILLCKQKNYATNEVNFNFLHVHPWLVYINSAIMAVKHRHDTALKLD